MPSTNPFSTARKDFCDDRGGYAFNNFFLKWTSLLSDGPLLRAMRRAGLGRVGPTRLRVREPKWGGGAGALLGLHNVTGRVSGVRPRQITWFERLLFGRAVSREEGIACAAAAESDSADGESPSRLSVDDHNEWVLGALYSGRGPHPNNE